MKIWEHYRTLVQKFSQVRLGILGDIVADRFIYGVPERLSREAPIPIIRYESEDLFPGCAGNTIRNLEDLGAQVFAVSVLGRDRWGQALLDCFSPRVQREGLLFVEGQETVTKTRILAGDFHTKKQQVVRIDRGDGIRLSPELRQKLLEKLRAFHSQVDGWIISDYGYHLIWDEVLQLMAQFAREKPVVVDSRKRLLQFRHVTLLTPNEEEATKASGRTISTAEDVPHVAEKLLSLTQAQGVLITRGNQGMFLKTQEGRERTFPCFGSLHIADVTGAGDTVTAIVALTLAAGGSFEDAAQLATYGASVVVMKLGTATCSQRELEEVISQAEREE